jgi:hypothetical protein
VGEGSLYLIRRGRCDQKNKADSCDKMRAGEGDIENVNTRPAFLHVILFVGNQISQEPYIICSLYTFSRKIANRDSTVHSVMCYRSQIPNGFISIFLSLYINGIPDKR